MTNLQSYIVKTLPPEMGMDTLRESLTEWLPSETLANFHSYGISFRPLFVELVESLPDQTLSEWIQHLFSVEADPLDLPPAPAPQSDDLNSDLVDFVIPGNGQEQGGELLPWAA